MDIRIYYLLSLYIVFYVRSFPDIFGLPFWILVLFLICFSLIINKKKNNFSSGLVNFVIISKVLFAIFLFSYLRESSFLYAILFLSHGFLIFSINKQTMNKIDFNKFIKSLYFINYILFFSAFFLDSVGLIDAYELDRGVDFRFIGFSDDPNFLSFAILFPLLFVKKFKTSEIFYTIFCLATLYFTRSRSMIIILSLIIIINILNSLRDYRLNITIATSLIIFIVIQYFSFEEFLELFRFDKIDQQSRLYNLWIPAIDQFFNYDTFWTGVGNLTIKNAAEFNIYLHNTFLEIFLENGFVGLILFVIESVCLIVISIRKRLYAVGISFLVLFINFSLHFHYIATFIFILLLIYPHRFSKNLINRA